MQRTPWTQLLLAACLTMTAGAQMPGAGPGGPGSGGRSMPPTGPLVVQSLTPDVFWVQGGVGNTGFIVGDKGVIVIDATVSTTAATELLADIAKVTPKPVTTLILTHGDIDHVGGVPAFPAGIEIIAQENNKARMAKGFRMQMPADHLPNHVVKERETITADGVKLELLHWAPAHTDGDLVIFLPAQKIVFTGDIFAMDQPRALIHQEQGGTSAGWVTTAKGIVALNADRFVVGHGTVRTKAELQQRVDLVTTEREQIIAMVKQGKSLPEIQAAVGDAPPANAGPGGPRFTSFSQVVYEEETAKK